jgi:hypothetical protein
VEKFSGKIPLAEAAAIISILFNKLLTEGILLEDIPVQVFPVIKPNLTLEQPERQIIGL